MTKVVLGLLILVLAGCSVTKWTSSEAEAPEAGVTRYKDRFYLSLEERERLEKLATNGDKESARLLANYWLLYRHESEEGNRWLRQSEGE